MPGEAAATCKERQQCWAAEHRGTWKCHPFAQLQNRGHSWNPCALLPTPCGVHLGTGRGDTGATMLGPSMSPGQGDTHTDLSTSCRIFFTESLMLKAMLLRMFLK